MVSVGKNGQSRVSKLRIASVNSSSRLWGVGAVPSCLVPGPG